MQQVEGTKRATERFAWLIVAAAIAFSIFVRGRLASMPLERDEGEYAYAGQLLLRGIPPYQLAYNMKLPGTYVAYAGIMAVLGETAVGIHLGLIAVNVATVLLIFLFARELFDSLTAAMAAAAFTVLSASPTVLGLAGHATHFVTLFGVAGLWLLWRAIRSDKLTLFLTAGGLLGMAFLMKQQAVFLACFGGLAALAAGGISRRSFTLRTLARCSAYTLGAVTPLAATCIWLWLAGSFDKFWFWTVQYARTYVGRLSVGDGVLACWFTVRAILAVNWPLWALAALGAIAVARDGAASGRRAFMFGLLLFSFLCVCPGLYFRNHYFIVLLPGVAIFSAVGAKAIMDRLSGNAESLTERTQGKASCCANTESQRIAVGLASLIPVAAILLPVWQERDIEFRWSPDEACRRTYEGNPFVESIVIAEYLRTHSAPDARVAVVGSEPQIYFYANRLSATGYIYTYGLMEPQPFARRMQDEMISEIEATKPEFIVYANIPTSWLPTPHSDPHIFEWLSRYTSSDYSLVGLVNIFGVNATDYKWDAEAGQARPSSDWHLLVFRRIR